MPTQSRGHGTLAIGRLISAARLIAHIAPSVRRPLLPRAAGKAVLWLTCHSGGANRAARAFRLAAQGCHHAKNAMGAFYRRIQARAGGGKSVVATARKIAERVYRLLKYGETYVRQAMNEYENADRIKLTKGLAEYRA